MPKQTNLSSLGCGQEAVVAGVCGAGAVTMRLMEIGLIPGRTVSILRRAPFGGPVEILVDRTRLAVRTAEADCIQVTSGCVSTVESETPVPAEAVAV